MENEKTSLFSVNDINSQLIRSTINEVSSSLKERGYNPVNQLVGYIISGDPGYISSYNDSRNKIQQLDRTKIVEVLLTEFNKGLK